MYFRAFGKGETDIQPAGLLDSLRSDYEGLQAHFRGDDQGWFSVEFVHEDRTVQLQRFLVEEEGVREQLNVWVAWLEQHEHADAKSMVQTVAASGEMFLMEIADDDDQSMIAFCRSVCDALAKLSGASYQIDGDGFYSADGKVNIPESSTDED